MNSPGIIQGFWPAIKNIKLHAQKTMKSCSGSEGKNKVYVNCKENYKDINDYNRLKKLNQKIRLHTWTFTAITEFFWPNATF